MPSIVIYQVRNILHPTYQKAWHHLFANLFWIFMDFKMKKIYTYTISGWYVLINIEQSSTLLEILNKDQVNRSVQQSILVRLIIPYI